MKYFVREKKDDITYYDTDKKCFAVTSKKNIEANYRNEINSAKSDIKGIYFYPHGDEVRFWTSKTEFSRYIAKKQGYPYPYNQLNMHYYGHACTLIKQGDSLETFMMYYREADDFYKERRAKRQAEQEARYPADKEGQLPYITSFKGIRLEREIGNKNRDTFDFIRVTYGVSASLPKEDLLSDIKRDYKTIANHAVKQLQKSKRYQRYGIPVNFLKITNCTLTRDRLLQFVFELKERDLCYDNELETENEYER